MVSEFVIQFNVEIPFETLFEKAIFGYLKSLKKEKWLIDLLYENLKIDKNIDLDYAIDLQID
ncbi:TPA: hypothetical protein DEG21_02565 [Patescibacteria group bacterium]|nr:hypothetical protein [Candidatus Gracilibacteria bacterium]HBY74758.1 hypothetical protein [Candidatus Gracilibacteria bacterium]